MSHPLRADLSQVKGGAESHPKKKTEMADSVIRCSPGEDHTNGFFVSCFIREDSNTCIKRKTEESGHSSSKKLKHDDDAEDAEDEKVAQDGVAGVDMGENAVGVRSGKTKKKSQKKKKKRRTLAS